MDNELLVVRDATWSKCETLKAAFLKYRKDHEEKMRLKESK